MYVLIDLLQLLEDVNEQTKAHRGMSDVGPFGGLYDVQQFSECVRWWLLVMFWRMVSCPISRRAGFLKQ